MKIDAKKIVSVVLLMVMALSAFCLNISAADVPGVPVGFVDVLSEYNPLARWGDVPSDPYDWSNGSYGLSGEFAYKAYTNYCFKVEAGEALSVDITIDYYDYTSFTLPRQLRVVLYKKGTFGNTEVGTITKQSEEIGNRIYAPDVTVTTTFDKLAAGTYYFALEKTKDDIYASIDGSICLKK